VTRFALVLLASCLCAGPISAQQPWVSFASKQARFSIEMPTQPKPSTMTTDSFIGKVSNEIFTSWEGNEKFTVDYS